MARDHMAAASRPGSCGEDSGRRSGRGVGTWLKVAVMGVVFFAARAGASDPAAGQRGGAPPAVPNKYSALQEMSRNMRGRLAGAVAKLQGKDTQMYWEMNSCPPKPLQVFEYGPSRPAWYRNPSKYKYQYVCVVATMGPVEEGIWHKRRAPVRWTRQPPFHIRIVRPNPAGMLDYMIAKGKVKLAKRKATIRRTDKRTGQVVEHTKPLVVLERTDGADMPKHIADMLEAQKEGREWKDPRPTKGRWGPSNIEEVKEEGVMELLAEAGIETQEEIEDLTKVIDKETGEKFDLRRAFDFGDTTLGYRRWRAARKKAAREDKKNERRSRNTRQ
eukprot:g19705.t1